MAKARPLSGLDPQAPTAHNARAIVHARLEEMYAYAPYVESPEHCQELHDLRIAAKRVRYTLEIFAEFLPASSQDFAEELAVLQDELGALHDSEVMLTLLRSLLPDGQSTATTNVEQEGRVQRQKTLLSPGLLHTLLNVERTDALTNRERHGLASFLRRQEQRRIQAYAAFRQHWDQLEQRNFRAEIEQMLAGGIVSKEEEIHTTSSSEHMGS